MNDNIFFKNLKYNNNIIFISKKHRKEKRYIYKDK